MNYSSAEIFPDNRVPHVAYFVNGVSKAMNVNGSVTNVNFTVTPTGLNPWYIYGVRLVFLDSGTNTLNSFGALAALTNGLLLRANVESAGVVTAFNMINWKTNLDLATSMRVSFPQSTATGFSNDIDTLFGEFLFKTPMRIDPLVVGENIECVVRDNLTGLNFLQMAAMYELELNIV